ncbi:MAG: GGDEF domain-containing protein [Polyangiales bacterium]
MRLDVTTGYLFLCLTDGLMALSLLYAVHKRLRQGEGLWIASLLAQGVGHLLLLLRGAIPWSPAGALGDVALSVALSLALAALSRMMSRPLPRAAFIAPSLAVAAGASRLLGASTPGALVGGAVNAAQAAAIVWLLSRPQSLEAGGRPVRLVRVGYGLAVALFALRVAGARHPSESTLDEAWVLGSFALIVCTGLGVVLMHREAMWREAERLAALDGLTGIFNRRMLMDLGSRALARASRHRRPLSLLMLDLDHFKRVNDAHGHQAGDAVLLGIVATIRAQLRHGDLLARYGGEEFCVLLPETDADGARELAERIRLRVEAQEIKIGDGYERVTVSIGVAAASVGPAPSVNDLIALSDRALYSAKCEGRNQVVVLHAPPSEAPPPLQEG